MNLLKTVTEKHDSARESACHAIGRQKSRISMDDIRASIVINDGCVVSCQFFFDIFSEKRRVFDEVGIHRMRGRKKVKDSV